MFTIKLYTEEGRQRIVAASSFTILRAEGDAAFEVTAYDTPNGDRRFDVGPTNAQPDGGNWDWAFIENGNGVTVERLRPAPRNPSIQPKSVA